MQLKHGIPEMGEESREKDRDRWHQCGIELPFIPNQGAGQSMAHAENYLLEEKSQEINKKRKNTHSNKMNFVSY